MTDREGFSSDDLIRQAREDITRTDSPQEEPDSSRPGPASDDWKPTAAASARPERVEEPFDTLEQSRFDRRRMEGDASLEHDPSPFGFERADTSDDSPTAGSPSFPREVTPTEPAGPRTGLLVAVGALIVGVGVAIFAAGLLDDETAGGPLEVGSCFNDPGTVVVSDVPQVDCDEPHDFEMIGSVKIQGEDFPGEDAIWDASIAECTSVFETYVGASYATSIWYLHAFTPTADGWDRGDRVANCLVFQFADDTTIQPVTGSARGDGR